MFYNANGLLMHNMVAGNFDYVQLGMPKRKNARCRRIIRVNHSRFITGWKRLAGRSSAKPACGCFSDYLREKRQQHDSYAALLALETRYCRQEPYLSLGRYIHVTALKSQAHSRRCKDKV